MNVPLATRLLLCLGALALVAGCAEEDPPRSVTEFMDDEILLEAALVRCRQNRSESRYDAECMNAREAVKLLEAKEEAARREELEAQSQRKREALRRTQQAAADARRRAAEAERLREEAAYLAQFGELPANDAGPGGAVGNEPMAVIPPAPEDEGNQSNIYDSTQPPPPGSNAPTAAVEPEPEEPPPANDLASIRDELKRRNQDDEQ